MNYSLHSSLILGTLIPSYFLLGMWMGLEIIMISIMPLFFSENNMYILETSNKYFLTQTLNSMLFLFSIFTTAIKYSQFSNLNYYITLIWILLY